jgi:hypothetical protein
MYAWGEAPGKRTDASDTSFSQRRPFSFTAKVVVLDRHGLWRVADFV